MVILCIGLTYNNRMLGIFCVARNFGKCFFVSSIIAGQVTEVLRVHGSFILHDLIG